MNEEKYTQQLTLLLHTSYHNAVRGGFSELDPAHLLKTMLDDSESFLHMLLRTMDVDLSGIKATLESIIHNLPQVQYSVKNLPPSRSLNELLQSANEQRKLLKDEYLSTEHIILGLTMLSGSVGDLLRRHGVKQKDVLQALRQLRGSQKADSPHSESSYRVLEKYCTDLTQAAREGKLDPVIGRNEEVRRIIQVLSRRTKNNPVLIGDPGVGKTAIVEEMARRIISADIPESLHDHRLLSLDIGSLLAGAQYRGEFEQRLKQIIKEVSKSQGRIILFVDELHTLMGAGKTDGAIDAANMLKPALSRGELRMIGATTLDEYRNYIEKDAAFERRFQPVYIDEPTVEESIAILRGLKERYEVYHGVRIQDAALEAAVVLSHRYIPERFLPDKAIDLLDEAASRLKISIESQPEELDLLEREVLQLRIEQKALEKDSSAGEKLGEIKKQLANLENKRSTMRLQWNKEKELIEAIRTQKRHLEELNIMETQYEREGKLEQAAEIKHGKLPEEIQRLTASEKKLKLLHSNDSMLREEVTDQDIAWIVSRWTGIPVKKMLAEEQRRYLDLEKILSERVVGQREAISVVSNVVRRNRSGLSSPDKPMGVFLFLGPTGVGKTELAKTLASFLFDDEKNITRIDMSEYMERHAVSRLIGAPPGYVGYEEGGQLTETVRRRPYSVVLLDEVEKAHPDVFNILLQLLDEGRLTDGQGKTVNFRNCIIIMTSNLASDDILEATNKEELVPLIEVALQKTFRPEFRNRLDEIVIFQRLEEDNILAIVDLELEKMAGRLHEKDISISFTSKLKKFIARRGFDVRLGARPLQRTIRQVLENPLAQLLLEKNPEGKHVSCDLCNEETCFKIKPR